MIHKVLRWTCPQCKMSHICKSIQIVQNTIKTHVEQVGCSYFNYYKEVLFSIEQGEMTGDYPDGLNYEGGND